ATIGLMNLSSLEPTHMGKQKAGTDYRRESDVLHRDLLISGMLALAMFPAAAGTARAQYVVRPCLIAPCPPPPVPPSNNVRYTPPLGSFPATSPGVRYAVTNVDSVAHTIKVEILDELAGPWLQDGPTLLQPLQTITNEIYVVPGYYFGRFTVLDGS